MMLCARTTTIHYYFFEWLFTFHPTLGPLELEKMDSGEVIMMRGVVMGKN